MAQQLPTRLQSTLSTFLLLFLSLVLAPLSFTLALFFSLTYPRSANHARRHSPQQQPTVLINGARMQKSLAICRTFARNGWRVVLAEEQGWGNLAAPRFSNSVSVFHLLPSSSLGVEGDGRLTPYISALVQVALKEKVDLFFPCSGAGSTGQDAIVGQILLEKTGGRVRSMIQTPELVETLHEKDRFVSLLQHLDMAAPHSEIVFSPHEALSKLKSEGYPRCILKCAAELDDIGRADMTLYPLLDPDSGSPDWEKTHKRLSNLAIPLCNRTPYILQEFIGDRVSTSGGVSKATEWCTHATVVDGVLTAFVCCPSNDMLMTYYPASHTIVGELALRWTSTFLYRLDKLGRQQNKRETSPSAPNRDHEQWCRDTLIGKHASAEAGITGQFSMDFIYQPPTADGEHEARLVAIECNPRVHTAICLLVGNEALAGALIPASLSPSGFKQALPAVRVEGADMDEVKCLSSLPLPVMEPSSSALNGSETDLRALSTLPATFASSRLRFYHAKSLLSRAYNSHTLPALSNSWIGHDLPARLVPNFTLLASPSAQRVLGFVHPLWPKTVVATPNAHVVEIGQDGISKTFDLATCAPLPPFTDPSFAKDDPWPFFALYHLQWPQLLLWQLLVRRKKWSRINVSTARIFEC